MAKVIKFYSISDEYGQLSNFAPYPVKLNGKLWPTVEHYFQAQKFTNKKRQEKIRKVSDPKIAARISRDRRYKLRLDWESVKVSIMREAVYAKFTQHPELGKLLVSTDEAKLVEHTIKDAFWGDGGDGHGKNMLGQILMEIREMIQTERLNLYNSAFDIKYIKKLIEEVENNMQNGVFVVIHSFKQNGRKLNLAITERLRKVAKKGKIWKSRAFLKTLKNAQYGFDPKKARSLGGKDGLFIIDRTFKPYNNMMKKIFDKFIDKPGSGVGEIARVLNIDVDNLIAVRLVSHSIRLLGVLYQKENEDWLVLVDYDDTK